MYASTGEWLFGAISQEDGALQWRSLVWATFPHWPVQKALSRAKPAILTASLGNRNRLLPMADAVTLGGASLNGVKWRGNASSSPPRWLRATLYTNFFSLRRFRILILHHPQTAFGSALCCRDLGKPPHSCDSGDMSYAVFVGLPALLSCFGNPLLSCRY